MWLWQNLVKLVANKHSEASGFFNIILTKKTIQVCFWKQIGNDVKIIAVSHFRNFDSFQDCLIKTDQCFQELGPESELFNQVVFSLDSTFLENGEIKKENKILIKNLCANLSLKAIGFIDNKEAIVQNILDGEHQNKNIVLIEYVDNFMCGTFISHGDLIESFIINNEDELWFKLKKILKNNLGLEKIVLFSPSLSKNDLFQKRQRLLSNFNLEQVNVDNLVFSFFGQENLLSILTIEGGRAFFQNKISVSRAGKQKSDSSNQCFSLSGNTIDDGFSQDFETNKINSMRNENFNNEQEYDEQVAGKKKKPFPFFSFLEKKKKREKNNFIESIKMEGNFEKRNLNLIENDDSTMIQDNLISNSRSTNNVSKKSFLIWWQWGVVFLFVGIFSFYFLLLNFIKVNIIIYPQEKFLSIDQKIVIDTDAQQADLEKLIFPGELSEEMFEKKDSVFVSGEKKIGEKAKGKIVILNKRKDGEKKFNNATVFTCNKVQFSLNEEIKVASASVKKNDEGETISYGRIESSLTAIEIGKEGNLVKDSKCVIGNHSPDDYEAIISENFTGGSSEILKIVTKKDQDELLAKVQATVLKEVADFFKKQSRDGKFYEFNNDFEIISNEFDKKVNEEATVLNLNLKIRAKAIVYKKSDMKEFVSQMLRQNLPEGYELSNKEPDLISNVVKDASASANKKDVSAKKTTNFIYLQVKVNQNAFAKIDSEEIKQQLNSLNYLKAKEVLQSRSAEIKDFEIKFQPSFAQFLGKIPQNKKNIFIDIIGNDET